MTNDIAAAPQQDATISPDCHYVIEGYDLPIWYAYRANGATWLLALEEYWLLRVAGDALILCNSWSQPLYDSGVRVQQLVPYSFEDTAEQELINAVVAELLQDVEME